MNTRDHILQLCERGDVDELRKYTLEIITMDRHARVIAELSEKLSTPSLMLSATQSPECTAVQSARGQKSIRVVEFLQQIEGYDVDMCFLSWLAATVEDIEFLDWIRENDMCIDHGGILYDAGDLNSPLIFQWYDEHFPDILTDTLGDDIFEFLRRMYDVDLSEADRYVVENVYTTERRGRACAEKISQIMFDAKETVPNSVYLDVMNTLKDLYRT